jgi:hypothetical protein
MSRLIAVTCSCCRTPSIRSCGNGCEGAREAAVDGEVANVLFRPLWLLNWNAVAAAPRQRLNDAGVIGGVSFWTMVPPFNWLVGGWTTARCPYVDVTVGRSAARSRSMLYSWIVGLSRSTAMSRLRSRARAVASSSDSSTLDPDVVVGAGRAWPASSASARAAANCCAAVRASSESRRAVSSCARRPAVIRHTDTTPQKQTEERRMIILEPRAEQRYRASGLLTRASLLRVLALVKLVLL